MNEPANHRMIRVDQAGEYGATRIYAGQLAVMGDRAPHAGEIAAMARAEAAHQARFDALMARRGVRPTALQPFWSIAGFALGAATALIGPEAAMACTAAVEEEIDKHYSDQLDRLERDGDDPELTAMVAEFRDDDDLVTLRRGDLVVAVSDHHADLVAAGVLRRDWSGDGGEREKREQAADHRFRPILVGAQKVQPRALNTW
jgi:ubiquinone biosynthesis monooxygenase Coq7